MVLSRQSELEKVLWGTLGRWQAVAPLILKISCYWADAGRPLARTDGVRADRLVARCLPVRSPHLLGMGLEEEKRYLLVGEDEKNKRREYLDLVLESHGVDIVCRASSGLYLSLLFHHDCE